MKRNFTKGLMMAAVALSVSVGMNAQGWGTGAIDGEYPVVINENFQDWEHFHTTESANGEPKGGLLGVASNWKSGKVAVPIYDGKTNKTDKTFDLELTNYAVAPTFYTQYYYEGKDAAVHTNVSKGFVELGRNSIYQPVAPANGELIIPQMEYIEGVQYSFSSTGGSKRGFVLFKSVDGGEWEEVRLEGKDINTSTSGTNNEYSGYGLRYEDYVGEANVSLKFTINEVDPQTVRIHDLIVYGTIGEGQSIGNEFGDSFVIKNTKEKISLSTIADIQLVSTSGVVVKNANAVEELNINDLPSGVYIVKATEITSGAIQTKKILK